LPTAEPLLLAFETATALASVALLRGEEPIDDESVPRDRPTAETLLPALDRLLRRTGVSLHEVEAFAVSVGPGAFTSLRIGIATLKGLAFGSSHPVAAVPTLAALARAGPATRDPVVGMLDARRGELYAAAYAGGGEKELCLLPEGVYTPDGLAERLPAACVLVGEGALLCGERLREQLGSGVRIIAPPAGDPHARHVGALGARCLARGEGVDPAALVPRYLRRAEAEVKRTGKRFERTPQSL
jgi:tRNA threonylcarbamoyladenosine biosynthesis protein TsaB